jgi:hypothetical protein
VTGVALLTVMGVHILKQPCTVLLVAGADGRVVAEQPRLRDRVSAHWRATRLDRDLADGVAPEASAALALRAERLTEPDWRWSMAGALRRVLRDANASRRQRLGRVTPNGRAVNSAAEELNRLADTLDDPGPVAAQGVARAWLLLTDGTGPLYNARSRISLCRAATQALRDLRPWPA